ncbi:SCA7 domain-containing protein [Trichonephila inaurata madagascariensis]|uniref:SCA7 domain-containing protein n=1 Tax=Trichonephila inaurata madagascariensis TaxID=2747483 RepID=A0A8X7CM06_9ARAC|nr:SCA7 domain-containing protein [Trichonephila inaurata madagascariensis]
MAQQINVPFDAGKKGKNTRKRVRRGQRGDYFSGVSTSGGANFREMTADGIRQCLSQMCGCSGDLFLGSAVEPPLADDVQIDVDTVDEDSIVPLWYTNQRAPRRNSSHAETHAGPNSSRSIGSRQEDFPSTSGHGFIIKTLL